MPTATEEPAAEPCPGFIVHTEHEILFYPDCDRYQVDGDGDLSLWAASSPAGSAADVFMHRLSYTRIERADHSGVPLDAILDHVRRQRAANVGFMGVASRVAAEVE